MIAHIRKQDPSVLARLDAHPAATEDAYVLPTESCPAPGMRTTGGGKVVAGLVDGKNAPPPGTVDLLSRLGQVDIS